MNFLSLFTHGVYQLPCIPPERIKTVQHSAINDFLLFVGRADFSTTTLSSASGRSLILSQVHYEGASIALTFRDAAGYDRIFYPEKNLNNSSVGWSLPVNLQPVNDAAKLMLELMNILEHELNAIRWNRNGDHPLDDCHVVHNRISGNVFLSEGKIVRQFHNLNENEAKTCETCSYLMHDHGFIDSGGEGHTVCPGSLIYTEENSSYRVVKPNR